MLSDDPDFETKAADVIGLYLNPPQHAAVFAVDEKTAIQALDRLDPVLPLSPGRIERHGFEYYRQVRIPADEPPPPPPPVQPTDDELELERDMESVRRFLPAPVRAAAMRLPDLLEAGTKIVRDRLVDAGVVPEPRRNSAP